MKYVLSVLMVLVVVSSAFAQDTVEGLAHQARRAYGSIPHEFTTYTPETSGLEATTAEQLRQYFQLLDAAVVARVDAQAGLQRRRASAYTTYDARMGDITLQLKSLAAKSPLTGVIQETLLALADQQAFFLEWSSQPGPKNVASHPKVRSASQHLHAANARLDKLFPKASANVKACNFNGHCALDFI